MSAVGEYAISGARAQFWVGQILFEVSSVKWGHALETEITRRLGAQSVAARSEGIYVPEPITGQCEVGVFFKDILPQLPANGYGNFRFNGLIYADHPQIGAIRIDAKGCSFKKEGGEFKVEPGASMMDIELNVIQYALDGKTINRVSGAQGGIGPSAPIGFAANITGATGLSGGFIF